MTTRKPEEEKKPITEAVWCDHAAVIPQMDPRAVLIGSPGVYVIVEEGKVKILCKTCFSQGIKLTWPLVN